MALTKEQQRTKFIEDTLALVEQRKSKLEELENKEGVKRIKLLEDIKNIEEQISLRNEIIENF